MNIHELSIWCMHWVLIPKRWEGPHIPHRDCKQDSLCVVINEYL